MQGVWIENNTNDFNKAKNSKAIYQVGNVINSYVIENLPQNKQTRKTITTICHCVWGHNIKINKEEAGEIAKEIPFLLTIVSNIPIINKMIHNRQEQITIMFLNCHKQLIKIEQSFRMKLTTPSICIIAETARPLKNSFN